MSGTDSYSGLFEAVFDTAPEAMLVVGRDGAVLAANPAFSRTYGFGREELIGKSVLSLRLVESASQAPLQSCLASLGSEGGPAIRRIGLLTSGGGGRWAELAGVAFRHQGRMAPALLLRDIAAPGQGLAEKGLDQGDQRYRSLFDHSPIPLWEEDCSAVKLWIEEKRRSGVEDFAAYFAGHHEDVVRCARMVRVTDVNEASAAMYAAGSKQELISGMGRVFSNETYDAFVDELQAIAAGRTVGESETVHHTLAGKLKHVLRRWSVAPGYEETLSKVLVAIVDITEHKRIERRLEAYARTLENAYKKLQKLDKMKDDFLSTVSHELRTPLTSIKGFAEILLNYEEDPDTRKEFLTIINNEAERLTRLVNDVLDLSRIEAGRMQWETSKLSMGQIVRTATASAHGLASQKHINLVVSVEEDLPPVWGDRDRFVQVITNLLSNAVKFSREGGEVRVKAELPRAEGGAPTSAVVKVSVSDDGIGIAPDDQGRIFDKFVQVGDTMTDRPIGTGLGLSICKEILGHYRGRIWVESELGKGSTFSFVVPVAEATVPDRDEQARQAPTPEER